MKIAVFWSISETKWSAREFHALKFYVKVPLFIQATPLPINPRGVFYYKIFPNLSYSMPDIGSKMADVDPKQTLKTVKHSGRFWRKCIRTYSDNQFMNGAGDKGYRANYPLAAHQYLVESRISKLSLQLLHVTEGC